MPTTPYDAKMRALEELADIEAQHPDAAESCAIVRHALELVAVGETFEIEVQRRVAGLLEVGDMEGLVTLADHLGRSLTFEPGRVRLT